jgi:hypothetical protein
MATYLFVTEEYFSPEKVTAKGGFSWSCTAKTREGDGVLVYVKGIGIEYEWEAQSDAERTETWPFMCKVRLIKKLSPAISMADLKNLFRKDQWPALYTHFRGLSAFQINQDIFDRINSQRK